MMRPNELTLRHRVLTTVAEVAATMAEVEALVVVAINLPSSWSEHNVEHLVGVAKLTLVLTVS